MILKSDLAGQSGSSVSGLSTYISKLDGYCLLSAKADRKTRPRVDNSSHSAVYEIEEIMGKSGNASYETLLTRISADLGRSRLRSG